ncbi:MAG: malate synthase A [Bdellovibrionales bacterium]|nr:malate synthase A [Bdellovibrionales bacterium]
MGKTRLQVVGALDGSGRRVLTEPALEFLEKLQTRFGSTREKLLQAREARYSRLIKGESFDFLKETLSVRESDWRVASCPHDLENRNVEITGPTEPKMMINALNSGADCFMADLEDALSPTWTNEIIAQNALMDAVRGTLKFTSPEGKSYALGGPSGTAKIATLLVRPRGWHLEEKHVTLDGKPMSGSLFDFGLYFFHNAVERLKRGTAPYFYLPKLESHLEARLWNDVFTFAQKELGIPHGSIRATCLIETLPAAFEMDEILYELREHMSGLNAGRWDYIFSAIKKLRADRSAVLPDRAQVSMTTPFMRAYTDLLVKTCHKRGAHAMGGMAAFVPSRKDEEVNRTAAAKVTDDKTREVRDGFDGTWVAHPDLVSLAKKIFAEGLGGRANQKDKMRSEVSVTAAQLVDLRVPGGQVTEAGVRINVSVALQYIEKWIGGLGAVALHNLMEDAATAEISRAQLWQWVHQSAGLADGQTLTAGLYKKIREQEFEKLKGPASPHLAAAAKILDDLVLEQEFAEFLTLKAYNVLD